MKQSKEQLKFPSVERVNISHIPKLVCFYRQNIHGGEVKPIGSDIGIPMNIIQYHNKVLGYSAKMVNQAGNGKYMIYIDKKDQQFSSEVLTGLLQKNAPDEIILDSQEIEKIRWGINKLVVWLNRSEANR